MIEKESVLNSIPPEAEQPEPNAVVLSTVPPTIQPVQEVTDELLHINVLPTGHTALDRQIHNFFRWSEKKLRQPEYRYIASIPLDPITHLDETRQAENQETLSLFKKTFTDFLWTGIECSNPESPEGERWDQLALAGIYDPDHRRKQVDLLPLLKIHNVRLGMPTHQLDTPEEWNEFDTILREFREQNIRISLDLQHFGLPSEFRNDAHPDESIYLNPKWPTYFTEFSMGVIHRYLDELDAVTLVNEPLITNRFSSVVWNEAMPGRYDHPMYDHYFIKRALLIAKAAVTTRYAIELKLQKEERRLLFIHNESCEYQPDDFNFNEYRRFLTSDLILGQDWLLDGDYQSSDMYKWMARQYVRQDHLREDVESLVHQLEVIREYHQRFQQEFQKTMKADTVFGVDYYLACEIVQPDHVFPLTKTCVDTYEKEILAGHRKGLARMCVDYWNRYQLPILHTETNFFDHGSEDWGVKQLVELAQLMKFGIPVLGFTWYSLMDQFNWDDAMMGSPNDLRLHPVGLIRLPDYEPRNFTKTILPDLLDTLHEDPLERIGYFDQ